MFTNLNIAITLFILNWILGAFLVIKLWPNINITVRDLCILIVFGQVMWPFILLGILGEASFWDKVVLKRRK